MRIHPLWESSAGWIDNLLTVVRGGLLPNSLFLTPKQFLILLPNGFCLPWCSHLFSYLEEPPQSLARNTGGLHQFFRD